MVHLLVSAALALSTIGGGPDAPDLTTDTGARVETHTLESATSHAQASRFVDVPADHQFSKAVEWLADQRITLGCNPHQGNTRFCPNDFVTRGQMAAFLSRAFFLRDEDTGFEDTRGHTFERAAAQLEHARITLGCNPHGGNTQFCPDDKVTRGQMAAFLVRALKLPAYNGPDRFTDDNSNIFEDAIERLAQAGITLGCNPHQGNTRFCPNDHVTRGQMAAFLNRAFGSPSAGSPGVNRPDSRITTVLGSQDVAAVKSPALNGPVTVTLADGAPGLAVGRLVVVPRTPDNPYGAVGRIVKKSGQSVVLEPVELWEVLPEVDFTWNKDGVSEANAAEAAPAGQAMPLQAKSPVKKSCSGSLGPGISAGLDVDLEPDVIWKWGGFLGMTPQHVRTAVTGSYTVGVTGSFSDKGSCSITTQRFTLAAGAVGPVPVSLTARPSVEVSAELKASISYEKETPVTLGVEYKKGSGWSAVRAQRTASESGKGFTWSAETVADWLGNGGLKAAAEVTAQGELLVVVGTSVMGAGGGIEGGPFIKGEVKPGPWEWRASTGLTADVKLTAFALAWDKAFSPTSLTLKFGDTGWKPIPFASTAPAMNPATISNGLVGQHYQRLLPRSGGSAPFTYAATGLPPGMTIDSDSPMLRGVPIAVGVFSPKVKVTDKYGRTDERTYSFTVIDLAPTIVTTSLPAATAGEPYTFGLSASNCPTPGCSWSATGLPTGLTLLPVPGVIQGTPTHSGTYNVVVTVTNGDGYSTLKQFSLTIADEPDPDGDDDPDNNVVFDSSSISVGFTHSCGVTATGAGYCWGWNQSAVLGFYDGLLGGFHTSPQPVTGSHIFTAISVGNYHSCGLTPAGAAYCWGNPTNGRLGEGEDWPLRVWSDIQPVLGGHTFSTISVGSDHTCGLTSAGAAYCWGDGFGFVLGNGDADDRFAPTPVAGEHTFSTLSAGGSHTCGVTTEGAAYCWGRGGGGELGNGDQENRATPTLVAGGHNFATISAGNGHTCGITTEGAAYCWGNGASGALGNGGLERRTVPTLVAGGHAFSMISAGYSHTCGVTAGSDAYCWGHNSNGELGNGDTESRHIPTLVADNHTFSTISAGQWYTCGVTTTGAGHCWGRGLNGVLGNGDTEDRAAPVPVSGGLTFAIS